LAAIAALVLRFLFKKKKKAPPELETEEGTTLAEEDPYISDYGLSDGVVRDNDGGCAGEIPPASEGGLDEERSDATEHKSDAERSFGTDGVDEVT
jgi:hypothetical protein